jgi:hypothetical protein
VGFLMLRGLPRRKYSDDDMLRIYIGLGSYISRPMVQSYLGDLIGHVVDVSDVEPKSRGYRKGGGQLMHTDSCDIIGLMCLRTALSGGESRISSALAVFNEIADKRPDVLEILQTGLWLKRADEDGRHATSTYSRDRVPFITRHDERFFLFTETGDLVIAKLSPAGYEELSRTHLLEPTNVAFGRDVVWCAPAYANQSIVVRNDKEIIRVSLAE